MVALKHSRIDPMRLHDYAFARHLFFQKRSFLCVARQDGIILQSRTIDDRFYAVLEETIEKPVHGHFRPPPGGRIEFPQQLDCSHVQTGTGAVEVSASIASVSGVAVSSSSSLNRFLLSQ